MQSYNQDVTEPDNNVLKYFQIQDEKIYFDELVIQFISKAFGKSLV